MNVKIIAYLHTDFPDIIIVFKNVTYLFLKGRETR